MLKQTKGHTKLCLTLLFIPHRPRLKVAEILKAAMRNRKELGSRESRAPWSDLPNELLEIIGNFLLTRSDVCRFRAVCNSWRSSIPPFKKPFSLPTSGHPKSPILIDSTVYHVQPSSSANSQQACTPTSWGWLVKVKERKSCSFRVSNSLSSQPSHPLPKAINLLDFRVLELAKAYSVYFPTTRKTVKVVFSSSPDYCPSFMRIAAGILYYLKIGEKWTLIDDIVSLMDYEDVIVYKNRFCAVDNDGRAVVIDSSLKVIEIASPLRLEGRKLGDSKILVESVGELFLVKIERICEKPYFKVFKLKVKQKEWVEVKSLDNRIMFLGGDCSFCVAAKDFGNGCKGNCIFFTDTYFTVFNLEDSSLLPVQRHPGYNRIFYPPPPSNCRMKS